MGPSEEPASARQTQYGDVRARGSEHNAQLEASMGAGCVLVAVACTKAMLVGNVPATLEQQRIIMSAPCTAAGCWHFHRQNACAQHILHGHIHQQPLSIKGLSQPYL